MPVTISRRSGFLFIAALATSLAGCTTPGAVSAFCASSAATLASARPLFEDMEQSCLREVNSREDFTSFKPSILSDPGCTAIGKQAQGAGAAAQILANYFTAINSLASFGTAKTGTDAQSLLSKAGAAAGAVSSAQTALGSIAQFLGSDLALAYRERQLEKDLPKVSENVSAVVNALVVIVQEDYVARQLASEEQKLSVRYREFARSAGSNLSSEAKLSLDQRWQAEEAALQARRRSALSVVAALQTLSKGFAELAASGHQLRTPETQSFLQPYVAQLQQILPQTQKAF